MNTVDLKLYKALRKTGVKPSSCLDKKASILGDIGFDEIDCKVFLYYLETIFDVTIEDNDLQRFSDLNAIQDFLQKKSMHIN